MNEDNLINVDELKPFPKFCCTIGMLPTVFKVSMTYEEQVLECIRFIKEEIIPKINQNALATTELQEKFIELVNYVDTYFDNLDVQEEINNKLDEMVESGDLQEIIEAYINLKSLLCFDTVAQMKEATNLTNGSYARTLGYTTKNDGGQATYKIREITNEDVVDEGSIIALNDETLIAELISNNEVIIECFGAIGDETTDDTEAIKKAITYCVANNKILSSAGKTYLINEDLTLTNCQVSFNWGKIKSNQKQITLNATGHIWDYQGDKIIVIENMKFEDTNVITNSPAISVRYLEFLNWHNTALTLNSVRDVSNIYYGNDRSDPNTISLQINISDKVIDKIQGRGGFTGIVINAPNVAITNSQLWLSSLNRVNGTLDGSKFIHVTNGTGLMFVNCISDTYQYGFYFEQNNIYGAVENFQFINNNVLYHDCNMYFINKFERLVGNALVRMTNFETDNIKFYQNSLCLLNVKYFDGTPEDNWRIIDASVLKSMITDNQGNDISSNITLQNGPKIKMGDGKLYICLDITFTTPNLRSFIIDTTGLPDIGLYRGYKYIPQQSNDGTNDLFGNASVTVGTNKKIYVNSQSSGNLKRVPIIVEFQQNF